MDVKLFDYDLPQELIADTAAERGESRMMVLDRKNRTIVHTKFRDLLNYIDDRTTIVFNSTKVIAARLFGKRETGGKVEFLLVKPDSEGLWEVVMKSSKRLKFGETVIFEDGLTAMIMKRDGLSVFVRFSISDEELYSYLDRFGDVPLPPYILKKRNETVSRPEDKERYQTVYASTPGSVAAPTAGLHFNDEIINEIRKKCGGHVEEVVLDVGLGTFLPVKSEDLTEHKMHEEHFFISENTAENLNDDKKNGRRILAVGTTTVRSLESAADENGLVKASDRDTGIFIYPGYKYKFVDRILTNFHLPQSTLLMMISAFADREFILEAYEEAVKEKYRFYSYGDCMLII
jgi:S-adenosylmethionine:tRNA ribosyltransferase-isomerase